jgi:hypothetical protein
MKEKELREHAECTACKQKIGHTGLPMFWTGKLTRHMVDMGALRRQAGLAMAMGSAALAGVMGPDEDMSKPVSEYEITLCEECALPIMQMLDEWGLLQ